MPDSDQDKTRTILELKEILETTEEEIVNKDKKLITLLEQDSAKNDLISALKDKLKDIEEENDILVEKIETSSKQKISDDNDVGFSKNAQVLLENKEKKVQFLLAKLKEKEILNKQMAAIAYGRDNKTQLLQNFNDKIELLEGEGEEIKSKLIKKDKDILDLIAKHKEKEKIIAKLEEEKNILMNKPSFKDEKRMRILLEKSAEKNHIINQLSNVLKEKEEELMKKEDVIISFAKSRKEKETLIQKLNEEVEKGHTFNKKLFKESNELRVALKNKAKRTADLEGENLFFKNKVAAEKNRFDLIKDENELLNKKISEIKFGFEQEIDNLNSKLAMNLNLFKEEKIKYETRIKKLLRENAEKEIKFKEKTSQMREMLDKQNYLVLEKEKKEKQILEDISSKFSEIFTLRNEISEVSKESEIDFLGRDEFQQEELNNLRSLIKIGLAHQDSLDDIKKSLSQAGYPKDKIEHVAKSFSGK